MMSARRRLERLEQRHGRSSVRDLTDDQLEAQTASTTAQLVAMGCVSADLTLEQLQAWKAGEAP